MKEGVFCFGTGDFSVQTLAHCPDGWQVDIYVFLWLIACYVLVLFIVVEVAELLEQ